MVVISVTLAQSPVTLDVEANTSVILGVLDRCAAGEWVVFPEGAVSGYSGDLGFLDELDGNRVEAALATLAGVASVRGLHVFVGSLLQEDGAWVNSAVYLPPSGVPVRYRKINLAMHERGVLRPGSSLPVIGVCVAGQEVRVGIQLCRELRFPEQWQWLCRCGAEVLIHLNNNASGETFQDPVWKSHLVSRAAENQRFVLTTNAAAPSQIGPTMAVDPRGEVMAEAPRGRTECLRVTVDTAKISDWYLHQARRDLVAVRDLQDGPVGTGAGQGTCPTNSTNS